MMRFYKRCQCVEPRGCQHPWTYRFMVFGRFVIESSKTPNRTLAKRIAELRKAAIIEGRAGIVNPNRRGPGVLFSAHVAKYLKWAGTQHTSSATKDPRVLEDFMRAIGGDRRLDRISIIQVERWKGARAKDVEKSTVNRELSVIRGCFRQAVAWKLLQVSPCASVKPYPGVDRQRTRVLTAAEVPLVLRALRRSTPHGRDLALIATVTLVTLMRISAVLRLHVRDLQRHGWAHLVNKGGRELWTPITANLRSELLARASKKTGYVFAQGDKRPMTQAAASNAFTRALRQVGYGEDEISHHTFRHTGATLMLASGKVNIREVMAIGGWTSLRMPERYIHVLQENLQAGASVMHAIATAPTGEMGTGLGTPKSEPTTGTHGPERRKS